MLGCFHIQPTYVGTWPRLSLGFSSTEKTFQSYVYRSKRKALGTTGLYIFRLPIGFLLGFLDRGSLFDPQSSHILFLKAPSKPLPTAQHPKNLKPSTFSVFPPRARYQWAEYIMIFQMFSGFSTVLSFWGQLYRYTGNRVTKRKVGNTRFYHSGKNVQKLYKRQSPTTSSYHQNPNHGITRSDHLLPFHYPLPSQQPSFHPMKTVHFWTCADSQLQKPRACSQLVCGLNLIFLQGARQQGNCKQGNCKQTTGAKPGQITNHTTSTTGPP